MKTIKLFDKPLHDHLSVYANDEPGPGGAHHAYAISTSNGDVPTTFINFQKGAVNEAGVNGISDESLLAILIDRAQDFQDGPFPSIDGEIALHHMRLALANLKRRFVERAQRGVEGYNKA
jgi:hypothetical protein